jgi:hypothetical protein
VGHGVWVAGPHPNIMCASHLWPLLCRCLNQLHAWSKNPECENLVWGRGMIIFTYYYMPRMCQNEGRFLPILMTRNELKNATHRQKLHNTMGGGTPTVQVTEVLRDRTLSNMMRMLDRCKWAPPAPEPQCLPAPEPAVPAPAQPPPAPAQPPPAVRLVRNGNGKARAGSPSPPG